MVTDSKRLYWIMQFLIPFHVLMKEGCSYAKSENNAHLGIMAIY